MDWDDIIYVLLLLISIAFGYYYRRISNVESKKYTGTLIGLAIIFAVSGLHILHVFIFTIINIFIIIIVDKRVCHLISFTFSFLYLLFFRTTIYFGIPYPPAHTNLVIMILTLKLVGLAFEVNTTGRQQQQQPKNALDICHYAFNYVGVLTGPYYSYRTYIDSLYKPYFRYTSCEAATIDKFTYIPLYVALYLFVTYYFPLSYALSEEFYVERFWFYRLFYVMPVFIMFRMRIYIGILLSECVCTMAGLGAYPKFTEPKSGLGPSKNFAALNSKQELKQLEYSFEAIRNIEPYETEVSTTFRESMKHWNMCVQYWMAVNIDKRFPNKQFRTMATLLVSAIWHGVYIGHYFCIGGAPFYLLVEDLYYSIYIKNDGNEKSTTLWKWMIFMFKMPAFSYLGMAFQLLTVTNVMRFYNSVYHFGEILLLILYIIGILIKRRNPKKKTN